MALEFPHGRPDKWGIGKLEVGQELQIEWYARDIHPSQLAAKVKNSANQYARRYGRQYRFLGGTCLTVIRVA